MVARINRVGRTPRSDRHRFDGDEVLGAGRDRRVPRRSEPEHLVGGLIERAASLMMLMSSAARHQLDVWLASRPDSVSNLIHREEQRLPGPSRAT